MDGSANANTWELQPEPAVERVRQWLALCECTHLAVRAHGVHVTIDAHAKPVARVTALGRGAFGLSFPDADGSWSMLIVDSIDEVMADLVETLAGDEA